LEHCCVLFRHFRPAEPSQTETPAARPTTPRRCDTCERDTGGKIRRSASARAAFRREHPCPATGSTSGACPGYVIDHVEALCVGGKDAPENMQWQTLAEARAKDRWECAAAP
jgi:hypothetical protein